MNMEEGKKIFITGNPFSWNYGTMALVISAIETLDKINKENFYLKESVDKNRDIERYSKIFGQNKLLIFGFNKGKLPMVLAKPLLLLYSIKYLSKVDIVLEMPGEMGSTPLYYYFSKKRRV